MTIGPEPMIRIFLRSVRLGTQAPRPRRLFFDQPIDDRRLRHGLFTAIEDIVQTPLADPDDLAVPPELLAQDAHAPLDALADRVGFEGRVARPRERRPPGLRPGPFGLSLRGQRLAHGDAPPPFL